MEKRVSGVLARHKFVRFSDVIVEDKTHSVAAGERQDSEGTSASSELAIPSSKGSR